MVLNVMFFKARIDAGTNSINCLAGLLAAAEDNQSKQLCDSEKARERKHTHTHTMEYERADYEPCEAS